MSAAVLARQEARINGLLDQNAQLHQQAEKDYNNVVRTNRTETLLNQTDTLSLKAVQDLNELRSPNQVSQVQAPPAQTAFGPNLTVPGRAATPAAKGIAGSSTKPNDPQATHLGA